MAKTLLQCYLMQKGITQNQIAECLEKSPKTVSNKMQGHLDFTWSEVAAICEIANIENPIGVFPDKKKERSSAPLSR